MDAEPELVEIEKTIHEESGKVSELFQKGIRMALIIAVCLAFFQQWSGAQPLLLYAPMIFQKAGFTQASDAILQSTILAAWLVLCTTFAFFLVEKFGRRQLLIGGALTMMVGMICTSLIFYLQLSPILLLLMMFISIGAYSVSLAPLTWLIMAEIFPNRVRGVAMSIASVVLWVSTVMVNQAFPFLSEISVSVFGSEFGIFIIYAVSCLATALFVWRYLPETRGKTLEEISSFWMKKKRTKAMKQYRLNRLFNPASNKCFDVAIDHGFFNEYSFLEGIEDIQSAVNTVIDAAPDAIQLTLGQLKYLQSVPGKNKPSLVLRADVANVYGPELSTASFSKMIDQPVLQAVRADAVCLCINLFSIPGAPEVTAQCIDNILRIKAESDHYQMPIMIEPLVFRPNSEKGGYMVDGDIKKILPLVRQAVNWVPTLLKRIQQKMLTIIIVWCR